MFHQKIDPTKFYAISDLHLSHHNYTRGVSEWGNKDKCRDFDTIEQMNSAVIYSINDNVPLDGTLFILGDILFGDKTKLPYWVGQINCKTIHYVAGNHCDFIRKNDEYRNLFASYNEYLEVFVGKKMVCMFHYPVKSWRERQRGAYMLSGHEHGDLPYTENELGLDVGWDVWHKPLSWDEIVREMKKKTPTTVGHHNKETN